MDLFATTEVYPTTVIGLLSVVIMTVLSGVGWAGARLLGRGGLIEESNKALAAVADCVKQHDSRQAVHNEDCKTSSRGVARLHAAALEACDQVEEICHEHGIELGQRVVRVREALIRE
jgi:hypothetical protein